MAYHAVYVIEIALYLYLSPLDFLQHRDLLAQNVSLSVLLTYVSPESEGPVLVSGWTQLPDGVEQKAWLAMPTVSFRACFAIVTFSCVDNYHSK